MHSVKFFAHCHSLGQQRSKWLPLSVGITGRMKKGYIALLARHEANCMHVFVDLD